MGTIRHTARKSRQVVVYDLEHGNCVWSRAGVLRPTPCINAYDCLHCSLDQKLKEDIAHGLLTDGRAPVGWSVSREIPRKQEARQKKCRHMLSGRVTVKYCVHDYDCASCAFHQMIEDETLAEAPERIACAMVAGFELAENHYYHHGHAWARVEYGGRVRVGLDDFATCLFGPFSRIRLPRIGQTVNQGEAGFVLERGTLDAACLSPVDGVVLAVNPRAVENGPPPVDEPFGHGWLMVVEPFSLRPNLRNLLYGEECRVWLEDESARLTELVTGETGHRLAATGGRALPDIYGRLPGLGWDRLKEAFLGA